MTSIDQPTYDLARIEAEARQMRALALKNGVAAARAWVKSLFATRASVERRTT